MGGGEGGLHRREIAEGDFERRVRALVADVGGEGGVDGRCVLRDAALRLLRMRKV